MIKCQANDPIVNHVIMAVVVRVIITERGACHHHPVGGMDLEMDRMGKAHIDDFIDDTVRI